MAALRVAFVLNYAVTVVIVVKQSRGSLPKYRKFVLANCCDSWFCANSDAMEAGLIFYHFICCLIHVVVGGNLTITIFAVDSQQSVNVKIIMEEVVG